MATTNKNSLSNEDPDRRWRADRRLLGWVFVFVSLFYFWTVQSTHYSSIADVYEMGFHGKSPEYYPLLTEGFMAGQLNLPIATKPELLRIDDPLDPTKSGALRLPDATYYRGKFYVYFGPAPVFLLYLPCKLLTGNYPTHSIGVLYFCVLGYGLNLLLLGALRRRFFPDAGRGWLLAAALTLGFATTVPQLLRRPDVWEVAISCGYLSLSAAIGAMYLALTRRSARWLAVASLAFGLAAASRPTLVFASLALLAPLAWLLRRPRGEAGAGHLRLKALLAGALPCALSFLLLLLYNYRRFDSLFEFGQRYQMHARDERHTPSLSPHFVPFNAQVYFLSPPRFTLLFPYVKGIQVPPLPKGQLGFEGVYGLLPTMPVLLAAALAVLLARRSWRERAPEAGILAAAAAPIAVTSGCFVLLFAGACNRYQVDFAPSLAVLAALGLLVAGSLLNGAALWKAAVRALMGAVLAWTVACSVFISIEHNGILRVQNPSTWQALCYVGDYAAHLYDRWIGAHLGPMQLRLVFPDRQSGAEVLFAGGDAGHVDTLSLHYEGHGVARLSLDHEGFGGPTSEPFHFVPGAEHTLLLEMGCLFPRYDFQRYSHTRGQSSELLRMRLYAALDRKPILDRAAAFETLDLTDMHWGWIEEADRPRTFSGKVLAVGWPREAAPLATRPHAPIELRVIFPQNRMGTRDPLVSTGVAGRADILYVEYLGANRIRFGLDHWSIGAKTWDELALDLSRPHVLRIAMGSLTGVASAHLLQIDLDGKRVVNANVPFYPVADDAIYVGYAPYLNSSCGLEFGGRLMEIRPGCAVSDSKAPDAR
jgi:hypothetical protein